MDSHFSQYSGIPPNVTGQKWTQAHFKSADGSTKFLDVLGVTMGYIFTWPREENRNTPAKTKRSCENKLAMRRRRSRRHFKTIGVARDEELVLWENSDGYMKEADEMKEESREWHVTIDSVEVYITKKMLS